MFKPTVSAVFSGERRYVIPLFQRPYVWTEKLQWEPLWEDIVRRAELELLPQPPDGAPHFLGAIVIQQRESYGDALLAHDVIDGQQRLTTFQLLLFALRDIASGGEDKQIAASLASWTRNANAMEDHDVEQFKVWPTSRDSEQFRFLATAGSREAVEKEHPPTYFRRRLQPRPRMIEAYLYFHAQITEWLACEGASPADRLRALRRVFDRRMQLVSIELGRTEEPQAIFETLNARGVRLLASDLLRNNIFQRAGKAAETLHKKHWSRFEVPDDPEVEDGERFWEIEQRQGRLNRARLDLFVQHYLTMKRGEEILSGSLFPEYKTWIEKHASFASIEDELRDLGLFADHFAELLRPTTKGPVRRFAERLRALDTSTAYPLVLALLGNTKITATERDAMFTDLESFLVRRMICRRPTKSYNNLFLQLLRDFEKGEPTRAAFRALLAAGQGVNLDWPSDDEFRAAWTTLDAYDELGPGRVEMILRAIDEAMTTAATESITIHGRLSVEHVMPQKWGTHWPLPAGVEVDAGTDARRALIHDFGNLTLLTQPLNTKVSNGPADKKLPEIALKTALRLSSYFQGRKTWTEKDIEERTAALFEWAKRVWPRVAP